MSPSSSHDIPILNSDNDENNVENIQPLRKPILQKLARQRPIQEMQLLLIYKWLGSLLSLLPTQLCRYGICLTPYAFLQFLSWLLHSQMHQPGALNTMAWTFMDVWHHHQLFSGRSEWKEEEAASAAAYMVEPVSCDLAYLKYRNWQSHYLVRYFLMWRLGNLSKWGPIHSSSSMGPERRWWTLNSMMII